MEDDVITITRCDGMMVEVRICLLSAGLTILTRPSFFSGFIMEVTIGRLL